MNNQVLVINCVFGTLFSLAHCLDRPEGVPVSINRRQSRDIYFLNQSDQGHGTCNEGGNTTYVIAERLCITNQHLFNGNSMFCSSMLTQLAASSFEYYTLDAIECSFLLTPMDEMSTSRLSVHFMNEDSTT